MTITNLFPRFIKRLNEQFDEIRIRKDIRIRLSGSITPKELTQYSTLVHTSRSLSVTIFLVLKDLSIWQRNGGLMGVCILIYTQKVLLSTLVGPF